MASEDDLEMVALKLLKKVGNSEAKAEANPRQPEATEATEATEANGCFWGWEGPNSLRNSRG
jgi:hypothetical protein